MPQVWSGANCLEWTMAARWLRGKAGIRPFSLAGHEYLRQMYLDRHPRIVVEKAAQMGVPLTLDTRIPTPSRWTTMGDIQVGDQVFDETGAVREVTFVSPIFLGNDCFEIEFTDGSTVKCDAAHRWAVRDEHHYRYPKDLVLTTAEIAANIIAEKKGKRNRYAIPVAQPLALPRVDLPVEPYTLGCWLGDGGNIANQITQSELDAEEMGAHIRDDGYEVIVRKPSWCKGRTMNLVVDPGREDRGRLSFPQGLRAAGVFGNKHVPALYLRASYEQRLALLQGMMDTDGHITKLGVCRFYNSDRALIDGVYELLMTLGIKATIKQKKGSTHLPAGRVRKDGKPGDGWVVTFMAYDDKPVFRLRRKRERMKRMDSGTRPSETLRRRIKAVRPIPSVATRCIAVDAPTHLYLCGQSFIPTHNTEWALSRILYWCDTIPRFRAIYFFPSDKHVEQFSADRVDTALADSRYLSGIARGNVHIRRVRKSMIYFRGMWEKRSTKSIPADAIVFDELDEAPQKNKQQARERMSHSPYHFEMELSTPTIPGVGIDVIFNQSDQCHWHIACGCHDGTVFEDTFPECFGERNGDVFLRCPKCGKEHLDPNIGAPIGEFAGWVPRLPENTRRARGYHINQMLSPVIPMSEIWLEYKFGNDLGEFNNSKLGKPYAGDRMPLSPADIDAASVGGGDLMPTWGEVYWGIDQGPNEWYIWVHAKNPNTGSRKLLWAEVVPMKDRSPDGKDAWERCAKIILGYKHPWGVIDAQPERSRAREFCAAFKDRCRMCFYSENQKEKLVIGDNDDRIDGTWKVTAHRTELLDFMVERVKRTVEGKPGGIVLLHKNMPIMQEVKSHLTALAKIRKRNYLQSDEGRRQVGNEELVYVNTRPDHFAHAFTYALIAEYCKHPTGKIFWL